MKPTGKTVEGWIDGANSLVAASDILPSQYAWGTNVVNRGGIVQTRPGYDFLSSITGNKPQGGIIFTPADSKPMMLVAVDGYIYFSKFPFKSFAKLEGLKFVATAEEIVFQKALKSVEIKPDGVTAIITPTPVVIIQDGATKPGYFDGSNARHLEPGTPLFNTPIGLRMAWASSRLWVSSGSRVYVSDLASPDTFTENEYLAERSNFELPGDVTGMVETADQRSLLIFTEGTTTAFQSNIRNRTLWGQTTDFQRVILPTIGCVSGRSPANQYGETWWFSRNGLINLNTALYSQHTSVVQTTDGQMTRSKRILAPDLTGICCGTYENFLLVSVPAGGRWNEQTWVIDQAPTGQAAAGSSRAFCGIWTGTRPVAWMRVSFAGRERIYFLSFDATARDGTKIHVWQAFSNNRKDNNGRISCSMETGMMKSQDLMRFNYAEFEATEILGAVDLSVYVAGIRGPWLLIKKTTLQAEEGSLGSAVQKLITPSTILQAFKPQSRFLKSEEFRSQDRESITEGSEPPGTDKGFQLLFVWSGRMGIKRYNIFTTPDAAQGDGSGAAGEQGQHNIINEAGEKVTA